LQPNGLEANWQSLPLTFIKRNGKIPVSQRGEKTPRHARQARLKSIRERKDRRYLSKSQEPSTSVVCGRVPKKEAKSAPKKKKEGFRMKSILVRKGKFRRDSVPSATKKVRGLLQPLPHYEEKGGGRVQFQMAYQGEGREGANL